MDVDQKATITVPMSHYQNLLRRDYLDDARLIITDACFRAGHPPKIDKPYEQKSEWQRGCVCGRQKFA